MVELNPLVILGHLKAGRFSETYGFLVLAAIVSAVLYFLFGGKRRVKPKHLGTPVSDEVGAPIRNAQHPDALVTRPHETTSTIPEIFERSVLLYANNPCLGERETLVTEEIWNEEKQVNFTKLTRGEYTWLTYAQVAEQVRAFGAGLLALGVKPGDNVAIYANTSSRWQITAQACFANSFPVVTVYATLGEEAVAHALNLAEAKFVITEGSLFGSLEKVLARCDHVTNLISIAGDETSDALADMITDYDDVVALGEDNPQAPVKPSPEDVAVIMFTSGSTGLPKGVVMLHRNIVGAVAGVVGALPEFDSDDTYIAYLPLAHVLELCAENVALSVGAQLGYSSPTTLSSASPMIKEGTDGDVVVLRPTLMAAVPLILDRVRKGIFAKVGKASPLVQKLFHTAYAAKAKAVKKGYDTPIWNKLVFDKIRTAALGGRLKMMLSGGAPLSGDTQLFMNVVMCCPVGQGYGLTETCGGGTLTHPNDVSVGRVGAPLPSCQIKLVDWEEGGYLTSDRDDPEIGAQRGEIAIQGANVTAGYYKLPDKTAEAFREEEDGVWFYTGDIGQIDADGVIRIIDRKKDLVKLAHGEYVSLGKVEACLKESKFVDNVMVYANSEQSYCVAVVDPNDDALLAEAGGSGGSLNDLYTNSDLVRAVLADIKVVGKKSGLNKSEIPQKVCVSDVHWTPETELVTAALKLKRNNLVKHFKGDLSSLYN